MLEQKKEKIQQMSKMIKKFEKRIYFLAIIFFSLMINSCKNNNSQIIERIDKKTKEKEISNYIIINNDTLLHGLSSVYDKFGNLKYKCNFNKGKLEGYLYSYNKNQLIKEKVSFSNDLKNGKSISFFDSGIIENQITYRNDTLFGDSFYNYNNGKIKKYILYDSIGRIPFLIEFEKDGAIKEHEGKPINCFLDTDKIKPIEKFKMDCLIANIPDSNKKVKFIYSDGRNSHGKIKNINNNYFRFEESNYRKGKNMLYVIVEYKFNKKHYNKIIRDTAFIDYYVD